jgi:site-specific DNA-methyltransferase (adenine-specific)
MTKPEFKRELFYGDNLDVLRKKIKDETVDLCYIDPPFNSKRNYFQIYNNLGKEDLAQAQAFIDTWSWSSDHTRKAYEELKCGYEGRFTDKIIKLIDGLYNVLEQGSLLAYLVNMTVRIVEIHRVLKPTGSFYLHCDPTASHYLKIILDAIFCDQGGNFQNEIVWHYSGWNARLKDSFSKRHDVILFYSKKTEQSFNSYATSWESPSEYARLRKQKVHTDESGKQYVLSDAGKGKRVKRYLDEAMEYGKPIDDVWNIDKINNSSKERLGYPTQKPEALLERIIKASSNEGDVVLDAFCGCGTTVVVAEKLNRSWIGIDITYQSISLILKRLKDSFPDKNVIKNIKLDGIPKDMESAIALANKEDDRVRKEFEKWAILTYTDNYGIINDKKGADKGIDGVAYFTISDNQKEKIIFQVKSGNVNRSAISTLRGDMVREKAAIAILITLQEPTKPMKEEATTDGFFIHPLFTNKIYNKIQIITIKEIIEGNKRLEIGLTNNPLKDAKPQSKDKQLSLNVDID